MRYIDADKLIDKIFPIGLVDDGKYTINAKAVKIAIDKMPTADVVPKSEVDRLRFNLQVVLEEIPETKREFAKEIFEEIRNRCGYSVAEHDGEVLYHTKCYSIMATELDKLEKKYTESEGNI